MGLDYTARFLYGYKYDTLTSAKGHTFDFHEDTEDVLSKEVLTFVKSMGCDLVMLNTNTSKDPIYFLCDSENMYSWSPKYEDSGVEKVDNILKGDPVNTNLQTCKDFLYTYGLSTAKMGGGKLSWWFVKEVY